MWFITYVINHSTSFSICQDNSMITVSKGLIPPVLAQGWENDLGTRPDMSIKVGFSSHDMRIAGRIVGVQSTKQSV